MFLAFTSATVVTGLTSMASTAKNDKGCGENLGNFRSKGQLGRCLGPLLASFLYWVFGSRSVYLMAGLYMISLATFYNTHQYTHQS
jgi:hypothetical protein